MTTPDVAFGYAANEVKAFTDGDCWVLATQIHRMSNYTLVTLGSAEEKNDWYHVAVRLPDNRIADIEGIWKESEWIAVWQERAYHNSLVCNNWELDELLEDLKSVEITVPWYSESERSAIYAEAILTKVKEFAMA